MLKLNDLFENFDLAYEALELYGYDRVRTEKVINYYRLSANAIYPFVKDSKIYFLRLAPVYEKDYYKTVAEIEVIEYLRNNGINTPEVLKTKNNEAVTTINTRFGSFVACAFKRVNGDSLDDYFEDNKPTKEMVFKYGELIGKYHNCVSKMKKVNRGDMDSFLNTIESNLVHIPNAKICDIFYELREQVLSLPITDDNYGLIHYDMELDNVFYDDELNEFSVIDFDDSCYFFYNMDIERVANEIRKLDINLLPDFYNGYKSVRSIDENIPMELMRKLAAIQHYTEIYRTLSDEVLNKPSWMDELIEELIKQANSHEKILLS